MKACTVGIQFQVALAKRTLQSVTSVEERIPVRHEELGTLEESEKSEKICSKEQTLVEQNLHVAQIRSQQRVTKIEALRSLVQAGLYRIDSQVIAECLLNNETHFV